MHLLPRVRVTLHVRAPETELGWDLGWVGGQVEMARRHLPCTVPLLLFVKPLEAELRGLLASIPAN